MRKLFRNIKNECSEDKGFTMAELLIVVAIIGILVGITLPIFQRQVVKAKIASDQSMVRTAKSAALSQWLIEGCDENAVYYFNAKTGTVQRDATGIEGYGQYDKGDMADVIGATGIPNTDGTPNYITVVVNGDGTTTVSWSAAYGYKYKVWATSQYARKEVELPAETSQERLTADIDIMKAIGHYYLGMTKEEFLKATNTPSWYQGRLTNSEGVGIISYRNQEGTNPQLRGDYTVLSKFGFSGEVGSLASNSYTNTSKRLLFSDYFNSTAEGIINVGKLKYDPNGKICSVTVWVREIKGAGNVPSEFQAIEVSD